jgi:hypothetical protein
LNTPFERRFAHLCVNTSPQNEGYYEPFAYTVTNE